MKTVNSEHTFQVAGFSGKFNRQDLPDMTFINDEAQCLIVKMPHDIIISLLLHKAS